MAIIKCKMCGGDIELAADKTFGTCEYCGSTMTFPKLDDEQRAAAFNRGNHFRRIGEFDKALAVYERIVREDDTDAEAHWCCALCRFGIEYVEDPATLEYLPTCHRASFDSFLEDVDYLAAVEHSDGVTKRQYQKDAAKIAEVQRGILATSQNEEPFDVFICYKESDENGERTRDSLMAQDVYYQLTDQGYRVFFSRITLEDMAGKQYEPYIFAALNSAKVMIVIGTKSEYMNAVWVKNEWSRFLAMMKKDRHKLLLPCYRDMDPYDMPEQLSVLQSYDMGKIGFIQDLIRGIKKVIRPAENTSVNNNITYTDAALLIKRAFLALEDKDWKSAEEQAEKVLNINPECAEAYLIKLLSDIKIPTVEQVKESTVIFSDNTNYLKAIRFADSELKESLSQSADYVLQLQQERIFKEASELLSSDNIKDVKKAKSMFKSISAHKHAGTYISRCDYRISELELAEKEVIRNQKIRKFVLIIAPVLVVGIILYGIFVPPLLEYKAAVDDYNNGRYMSAYDYFSNSTYKNSAEMALKCQYGYVKVNYNRENLTTYEYLKELKRENYKDASELFKELYTWDIELTYCNTDSEDYNTNLSSIPQETSYLHMGFVITGGEPGKVLTMYHTTQWPGGSKRESSWYWEEIYDGSGFWCEWGEGVSSDYGTFTMEFYDAENNEYIDRISITVE